MKTELTLVVDNGPIKTYDSDFTVGELKEMILKLRRQTATRKTLEVYENRSAA